MTLADRAHAIEIWQAGVEAVASRRLVEQQVHCHGPQLSIAGEEYDLTRWNRIVVVGGGKAGAGMATGMEAALGAELVQERVVGWVNVPADCVTTLQKIHLHAGRPAGVNEPTEAGVQGTAEILRLVASLTPRDLCVVLLSGGGSALLPSPAEGLTLNDKQQVTRGLMQAGATIEQLNTVRRALSRVKGGGLLRAMPAGRGIALIISDVVDDPLEVIASGPTVAGQPDYAAARDLLQQFLKPQQIPPHLLNWLASQEQSTSAGPMIPFVNRVIGNNQTAVQAAADRAIRLGYTVVACRTQERGIARNVGVELAEESLRLRGQSLPASSRGWCVISGGEPIVQMVATSQPRKGGRNQELVLAIAKHLWNEGLEGMVYLSGGTDGEDGPTDAAGAVFDAFVRNQAIQQGLTPDPFLAINNSYPFFERAGGLLKTGPTHTNVMDLRVALIQPNR